MDRRINRVGLFRVDWLEIEFAKRAAPGDGAPRIGLKSCPFATLDRRHIVFSYECDDTMGAEFSSGGRYPGHCRRHDALTAVCFRCERGLEQRLACLNHRKDMIEVLFNRIVPLRTDQPLAIARLVRLRQRDESAANAGSEEFAPTLAQFAFLRRNPGFREIKHSTRD